MATRRAAGAGSVVKLADGRWQARLELPSEEGTPRKRKVWYAKTKADARTKLARGVVARADGRPIAMDERGTVGDFLNNWLRYSVQPNRRPKTYISYEYVCRAHLIPALGRIRLTKLDPDDVRACLAALRACDSAKELSPRTRAYTRVVLRRALNVAIKDGKIARNAAALTDPPPVENHEIEPLNPEQARAFLDAVAGHRLEALFSVALAMGLRDGEALGLRWADVDFEARTITVRRQLQRINRELRSSEPKTKKSRRTIVMPSVVADRLRAHRVRQLEERLAAGSVWQDDELVFTTKVGTPVHPENLGRALRPILQKAGLPKQRFHDLRHACASLLFAQGLSAKAVQETLGHSQIATTIDLYTHMYPELRQDVADRMDEILMAQGS